VRKNWLESLARKKLVGKLCEKKLAGKSCEEKIGWTILCVKSSEKKWTEKSSGKNRQKILYIKNGRKIACRKIILL
jgi:hypothetical protein